MAEKRKLMSEMEKCFKKIDEGLEIFEDTMVSFYSNNSFNTLLDENERSQLR
jgi:hypothetical protein